MYFKTVVSVVLIGIPLDKQMEINCFNHQSEWNLIFLGCLKLDEVVATRWYLMSLPTPSIVWFCMIFLLYMPLEGTNTFWVLGFSCLFVSLTFSSFRKLYSPYSERRRWMCPGSRSCHVESACIASNESGNKKGIKVTFLWNEALSQQINQNVQNVVMDLILNFTNEIRVVAFSKKMDWGRLLNSDQVSFVWFSAFWFFLISFQMAQICPGSVLQSHSISWHFTTGDLKNQTLSFLLAHLWLSLATLQCCTSWSFSYLRVSAYCTVLTFWNMKLIMLFFFYWSLIRNYWLKRKVFQFRTPEKQIENPHANC